MNITKILKLNRIMACAHSSFQNENFFNTSKKASEKYNLNLSHSALFHMETGVFLK